MHASKDGVCTLLRRLGRRRTRGYRESTTLPKWFSVFKYGTAFIRLEFGEKGGGGGGGHKVPPFAVISRHSKPFLLFYLFRFALHSFFFWICLLAGPRAFPPWAGASFGSYITRTRTRLLLLLQCRAMGPAALLKNVAPKLARLIPTNEPVLPSSAVFHFYFFLFSRRTFSFTS